VLTPDVTLAAVKRAEDSEAIIVRLYETAGREVRARVRLSQIVPPNSPAVEVDLLERPTQPSTARMEGDTLIVRVPAYGIASVAIG
jgi:alpha-mannosidase